MIIKKISDIKEGDVLARPLYGEMGELLLKKGTKLNIVYIRRLKLLGYGTLYIDDGNEDIEVTEVIDQELRMKAVRCVKNLMINWSDEGLVRAQSLLNDIIDSILNNKDAIIEMIDLRTYDNYTFYHCINVAVISIVMSMSMGKRRRELYEIGVAALLHDIGKTKVPINILNKPGKLTPEEYEEVKKHSELGYEMLKDNIEVSLKSRLGVLNHHEHYNGEGYPMGKKGKKISEYGRIICIADVYDALISDRTYRKGLLPSEAIEYIMANSGIMFDPQYVGYFLKKVAPYAIGECVQLSNGEKGIVAKNNSMCCLRPKVRLRNGEIIDLMDYRWYNVTIIGINEGLIEQQLNFG